MKFKANTRRRALEYEKEWVQTWKANKTFEKSVAQRPRDNSYVFYDGPPFISGVPHHGTLLPTIVKDIVPRYQTMKGKRVERVWGWDCHGLPAERFTEKKLGLQSRQDVLDYGIEEYIMACRDNMVQTADAWEGIVDRIGRWVDFDGAYKTMDKDYMESVWWAFKTLYEKGKIYEGEKVLMYCTLDATPLSKAEVTMDAGAYQDVTDPSAYVKFELLGDGNAVSKKYLLAWTTTPWTLSANTALAVNPALEYVEVEHSGEILIVAKALVEKVFTDEKHQLLQYTVHRTFAGSELVGQSYCPLDISSGTIHPDAATGNEYKVWAADFVSSEDGTGIVHVAPAFGEDDHALARAHRIPLAMTIDANGNYLAGEWAGQNVWDINKTIAKTLKERGAIWKIDYIRHSYPHCHRCNTRLMYRAHPSWFMDIDGQRTEMLEQNTEHVNWFPLHLKHGRFENTVQTAPDWNLSRDRFWATAMPVWKATDADGREHVRVIGSYAELKQLSGIELDDYHRPWVDDVTFEIDGLVYKRVDKVLDCWFESGSMPFAQFHYPFENKQKFEDNFPGDFIVEYVGQVRAWFYYLHAVNVGLFGRNAFKNVITTGTLAGNDGRKMSKSYGNFTDPNVLMDQYSADSLRFLLAGSPLMSGEDFDLHDKDVSDVARKLSMIWNMYDFFTMYAEVDGWEYDGALSDPSDNCTNPLDSWIISRLHQLVSEVETHMDAYNLPDAMSPILPFIEDASNWYVRRSRRRFWKGEDDADKAMAYKTLHYVLVRLAYVLAPFTPFLAEELHSKLTGDTESIHLKDWLPAGHVNELVLKEMAYVRQAITDGLAKRAAAGIKVRQPLGEAVIVSTLNNAMPTELNHVLMDIIKEELNVKKVSAKSGSELELGSAYPSVRLNVDVTPELKREGLMREVIRHIQNARKKAGLNVDDRIVLALTTEDAQLAKAIDEYGRTIAAEVLAQRMDNALYEHAETVVVEGARLDLSLQKA